MRILLVVVVLLAVGMMILHAIHEKENPPEEPMQYATYSDPGSGIAFDYPQGWNIVRGGTENGVIVECPTAEADWKARVVIRVTQNTQGPNIQHIVGHHVKTVVNPKKGVEILNKRKVGLGSGLGGYSVEYECFLDGIPVTERDTILFLDNRRNLIIVTETTATFTKERYGPMLYSVMRSLREL